MKVLGRYGLLALLLGSGMSQANEPPVLSVEALQQVKRIILAGGQRCTFSNMYNHNPCLRVAGLDLFLIPDPGPDGHPQWNLNSDPAKGDFHRLLVVPVDFQRAQARAAFFPATGVQLDPDNPAARALLTQAVTALLRGEPSQRPPGLP